MLLRLYLKRNLKRNNLRGKIFFLCIFFILFTFNATAITSQFDITLDPDITIKQNIQCSDEKSLFYSLEEGYRSQIFTQIRLYRKKSPPYWIPGDELLKSIDITKDAEFDIFSQCYKLIDNEKTALYESEPEFIEKFLTNEICLSLNNIEINPFDTYYVKIRSTLINKLYLAPFNILYLFNTNNRLTTGWLKKDVFQD